MEIKHKITDAVLYTSEKETLRESVIKAVELTINLRHANLEGANLMDANLVYAKLVGVKNIKIKFQSVYEINIINKWIGIGCKTYRIIDVLQMTKEQVKNIDEKAYQNFDLLKNQIELLLKVLEIK